MCPAKDEMRVRCFSIDESLQLDCSELRRASTFLQMLVPMRSRHTFQAVSHDTQTATARVFTLVPHASDMMVAATTDVTLATLNLCPDISILIKGAEGVWEVIAYHHFIMMVE